MNAMYCGEQIRVPEELGAILKQFTKAAIRDSPKEGVLLKWAANYFSALSGQPLPFDETGRLMSEGGKPRTSGSAGQMVSDVLEDAGGFESVEGSAATENEAIIRQIFQHYDTNGSGRLERGEVGALIADLKASMGIEFSEDQHNMLMDMLDTDKDGKINLEEFRQLFFASE
jgi:Ca2+-binding EF-hand superfamily protein